MKMQFATAALALAISTTASAATISFNNSTGSYSSGGVTATVTVGSGSLSYNGNALTGGPGIGVKGGALDFTGALSAGDTLTVKFNQAVTLTSASFTSWTGGITHVQMDYTGGSKTLGDTVFDVGQIHTISTGGLTLNSFTLSVGSLDLVSAPFLNSINFTAAPTVPVPAAAWLMGSGLAGLAGLGRRRKVAA